MNICITKKQVNGVWERTCKGELREKGWVK